MNLLVGTHTFAAAGDAARRQAAGVAALSALQHVTAIDLQFREGGHDQGGIDACAVLRMDSNLVTGRRGARKPIVQEIFDALCARARASDLPYFCFMNADIVLSQQAVDWIRTGAHDVFLFSREDFDVSGGAPSRMGTAGVDVFAMSTAWWSRHRHRFRAYIAGEPVWDNVYTAIALCHANGVLENRRPLVRHEKHDLAWTASDGPFADYTRYLAALDAGYFSVWCRYWSGLEALRTTGASSEDEQALLREVFAWSPGPAERAVQRLRGWKARLRYARDRRRRRWRR